MDTTQIRIRVGQAMNLAMQNLPHEMGKLGHADWTLHDADVRKVIKSHARLFYDMLSELQAEYIESVRQDNLDILSGGDE